MCTVFWKLNQRSCYVRVRKSCSKLAWAVILPFKHVTNNDVLEHSHEF